MFLEMLFSEGLFVTVLIFAITMTVTPGPNNIMLLCSSVNYGAYRTVPHGVGIICGVPLMVLAVGFGLGKLFLVYPLVHQLIKLISIVYLFYFAWKIAITSVKVSYDEDISRPFSFLQAILFQWVNPKSWVMAIGSIGAFTKVGSTSFIDILSIAIAFLVAATISTCAWVFFGIVLNRILVNEQCRRFFNGLMALLLLMAIFPIIVSDTL